MSENIAAPISTARLPATDSVGWEGEGQLRATSAAHRATVRVLIRTYPQAEQTAAAMDCLAAEFRGTAGKRMQQFAWFLNAGVPFGEAIQRTPNLLHPAHAVALRMAEQNGGFEDMCHSLLQHDPSADSQADLQRSQSLSQQMRVLSGLLVAWFLLTFIAVFIVPTFQEMFDEFELELPDSFQLFVHVARAVAVVIPLLVMAVVIYFAIRAPSILEGLTNRWSPDRGGRRELPPALAVRALIADAIEVERPMQQSLGELSAMHWQPSLREKLQAAAERIGQGQDPWTAIAEQGLLSSREASVLRTAQSPSTQAWLLRWFVTGRVHRRWQWTNLAWRLTSFISLTVLAAIVALAALSIFSVLIGLIAGLS